ncbi:hypothetical protein CEXT_535271 [Caerostris extrusa]|uniref:Uncharacterized protein n=1 Tax=Caerostris extrusa TaxID=172846 RepID=A0AAV4WXK3_CAEEX|nr:hypothetical protein CEXT_535271 [Caerostris extrusa]
MQRSNNGPKEHGAIADDSESKQNRALERVLSPPATPLLSPSPRQIGRRLRKMGRFDTRALKERKCFNKLTLWREGEKIYRLVWVGRGGFVRTMR